MSDWQPIETAPKDGTPFRGRMIEVINLGSVRRAQSIGQLRYLTRKTWWGKTSHAPFYGWCHGRHVENIDLWRPTYWQPLPEPPNE